jgi:hypothetical protein
MVIYNCKICDFTSKIKTHYNTHLNTIKHIKNISKCEMIKFNINDNNIICNDCNKLISTKSHLRRHKLKYCKNKKDKEIEILKILFDEQKNEYEKERKQLYKQINKLIDKVGITTNIQSNTINLNSYGNEDLSHLTDSFKTKMLKIPFGAIPKIIAAVHFNDKKPENKNILLTNKKENKIKVFSGNKWIYKDKDETINDLVDGKYFILDSHYESKINSDEFICNSKYKKFRKFYDDKDKNLVEQLKKECELVLLNNR